jgi:hypothetical protein
VQDKLRGKHCKGPNLYIFLSQPSYTSYTSYSSFTSYISLSAILYLSPWLSTLLNPLPFCFYPIAWTTSCRPHSFSHTLLASSSLCSQPCSGFLLSPGPLLALGFSYTLSESILHPPLGCSLLLIPFSLPAQQSAISGCCLL